MTPTKGCFILFFFWWTSCTKPVWSDNPVLFPVELEASSRDRSADLTVQTQHLHAIQPRKRRIIAPHNRGCVILQPEQLSEEKRSWKENLEQTTVWIQPRNDNIYLRHQRRRVRFKEHLEPAENTSVSLTAVPVLSFKKDLGRDHS